MHISKIIREQIFIKLYKVDDHFLPLILKMFIILCNNYKKGSDVVDREIVKRFVSFLEDLKDICDKTEEGK